MNADLRELQKEELLAKIKELQAYLVKESDEAISKADPHDRYKDYYEGAHRAYELAVYTICDMFGIEPPEGWRKTNSPKLENFYPRPIQEVEYFGKKISIPTRHKWVATCADGSIFSFIQEPIYDALLWITVETGPYGLYVVGYCDSIGDSAAANSLQYYPAANEFGEQS